MGKRYIALMLCLILITALSTACGAFQKETKKKNNNSEKAYRLGITFDTFVPERWTRDRDVFVSTSKKLGATVDVQSANGDSVKQREQIQKFIDAQMDVIVIVAVDCFALSDLVTQAESKGIAIISYDRLIQGVSSDLYITVDNRMVGREMAETIMSALPDGGNVVMICGPEKDTNSIDVENGFEETIKDSNLTVVSKKNVKSWTPEYGFQAVNEAFANVDKIDAVMCGNDGLAGYAIRALSEQQLAGKVVVVGQDADLEACQRVVEGTQTMTVYKPIEQLAKSAAESAVKLAKGEKVEGVDIGQGTVKETNNGIKVPYWGLAPVAVTAENMDAVIVEPGFHLQDEVYLNVEERQ